jgi:hypothetical protein
LKYSLLFKIGLAITSLLSTLFVLEFLLRFYRIGDDERNLLYKHDEELGWFPQKGISRKFSGANTIQINHNSHGFRENEFPLVKYKKHLVFIGDSFAYGYDSEFDDRFSNLLSERLPNFKVFNLGVSGFSTDQEFLLLKKYADLVKPDIVYLLYHHNDWHGNSVNHLYNGYYKPYFVHDPLVNTIQLMGVPVPKSIHHLKYEYPFIYKSKIAIWLTNIFYTRKIAEITVNPKITFELLKELRKFVEQHRKADFKIGVVGGGNTPGLIQFLNEQNFSWISIDNDINNKIFTSSGHWTKSGNERAANAILNHLNIK